MSEQVMQNDRSSASLWLEAARSVAPLVMGYVPVGVAFGVLALKAGMSITNTIAMSVFVYAGSAQLIAVGMLAAGMDAWAIIMTTFVVNLRHLLMSAALSPYVRDWGKPVMAWFGFEITDETFALHSSRFSQGDVRKGLSLRINFLAHCTWVLASWAGAMLGQGIPDVEPLGLDYALPAMFIALLAMQATNGLKVLAAGFAGLVSVALMMSGFEQWSVIVATVLAATFGAGVETWMKKRSS